MAMVGKTTTNCDIIPYGVICLKEGNLAYEISESGKNAQDLGN